MQVTRRNFSFGIAALGLSACVGGGGASSRAQAPAVMPMVPDAGFDAWVQAFRPRALSKGISDATFSTAFRASGFIPGVIEKDRNQTEFTRTTEDYLAIAASDERLIMGRQVLAQQMGTLRAIEARYGVEPHVVAAFWGLESFFGTRRGNVPTISALATLAYEGRRATFFEQQLVAALKILQNGDTTAQNMQGSWAGAMGHTQFIPTSYQAFAVDFNGDGRRDIWSDDPTDALASTAAYLSKNGWTHGQPWGQEVTLPSGFNTGLVGRGKGRSDWADLGVRGVNGGLGGHGAASLLLPAGPSGPAFLLYQNFNVILRYNNAENYALGVGYLSDRLNGAGPLRAAFGPDAQGMTLQDRQELQRKLTAAGFDTQGADGVIGAKTIAAISDFQRARGLSVTGQPSMELLRML
ncbi:lytic murein transglycosylase [Cypionkella sp.]|uniref:lytic murein transglycosylase n=1 Tax=Cypionkella sp. TaxID=2811411 RepID=UPI00271DC6FA|nr:lytic murein transglycosylase [Cypionkella sp.]MDO8984882.1 lytic murein transglycosylase [Cypionkella sp.]MDP2048966.1 lytic murein transglycosylase [Cypionkella sp.]